MFGVIAIFVVCFSGGDEVTTSTTPPFSYLIVFLFAPQMYLVDCEFVYLLSSILYVCMCLPQCIYVSLVLFFVVSPIKVAYFFGRSTSSSLLRSVLFF